MLAFAIDRDTRLIAILNGALCECGVMHTTRVQLDLIESEVIGNYLHELLLAVDYADRSVSVTDNAEMVADVLNTIRGL